MDIDAGPAERAPHDGASQWSRADIRRVLGI